MRILWAGTSVLSYKSAGSFDNSTMHIDVSFRLVLLWKEIVEKRLDFYYIKKSLVQRLMNREECSRAKKSYWSNLRANSHLSSCVYDEI